MPQRSNLLVLVAVISKSSGINTMIQLIDENKKKPDNFGIRFFQKIFKSMLPGNYQFLNLGIISGSNSDEIDARGNVSCVYSEFIRGDLCF